MLKTVDTYDSWSAQLLQAALPVVRKAIGTPCAKVLAALSGMVQKAAATKKTAPADVGMVQDAVGALRSLEVESITVAIRLLGESERLVRDAEREIQESIAEAKPATDAATSGDENGKSGDGDGELSEDDEDMSGLMAVDMIAKPLVELVGLCVQTIEVSKQVVASWTAQHDAVLHTLITCAQAASTCIDSATCSAYEAEPKALMGHAASLSKVLCKVVEVLRQRCGVIQGHAAADRLATIEKSVESNFAALKAACEAAEEEERQEETSQKALGALSIS